MCSWLKKKETKKERRKVCSVSKKKNVWAWDQNKFGGVPKVHLKKKVVFWEIQDKVKG